MVENDPNTAAEAVKPVGVNLPWLPLPANYWEMREVREMTDDGAATLDYLLRSMWRGDGSIPDDAEAVDRLLPRGRWEGWRGDWEKIRALLYQHEGRLRSDWLDPHLTVANSRSAKAKVAALTRWHPQDAPSNAPSNAQGNAPSNAHGHGQGHEHGSKDPTDPAPRKRGAKAKAAPKPAKDPGGPKKPFDPCTPEVREVLDTWKAGYLKRYGQPLGETGKVRQQIRELLKLAEGSKEVIYARIKRAVDHPWVARNGTAVDPGIVLSMWNQLVDVPEHKNGTATAVRVDPRVEQRRKAKEEFQAWARQTGL